MRMGLTFLRSVSLFVGWYS